MRRVLAIAVIALRNAVRSRIVLLMLGMLLLAIIGLPLTVKSDGTAAGHVRIVLGYTLGFASLILAIATVWAGCGAVSLEIQSRQIHLVVTKPVHRVQIWFGKWLGLLILNAALLAFAGAVTYVLLRWTTRAERLAPGQRDELNQRILTARRSIPPVPVEVEAEVRRQIDEARARDALPPDVPESEVREAIRQSLLRRAFTVPPGGARRWEFDLPATLRSQELLLFRFRFSSSEISLEKVTGRWRIGREGSTNPHEFTAAGAPGVPHAFTVPVAAAAGAGPLVVEYSNLNDTPVTVLFPPDDGLRLLVHEGSFEANYARALLVLFVHLAFLSALGVAAGSLFSMPVASFASFCVLLIIQAAGYVQSVAAAPVHSHAHEASAQPPAFWAALSALVFRAVTFVANPLRGPDPLDLLASGELITGAMLGRVILIQGVLYTGLLALVSSWILNRREVALPS